MTAVSWKNPLSGNWNTPTDWSGGKVPGVADDVTIGVAGLYTIAMTTAVSVDSITLSDLDATLTIADPGVTETVAKNFANSGAVYLDAAGGGGTNLKIGGALTNSGLFAIGNAGLAKAITVTAAGLANSGEIDLTGGTAAQATLDVTGATPATLTGTYVLQGNALLEAPSTSVSPSGGSITAIAGHAELVLDGAQARVGLSGATATNSGLAGLASNAGTLAVQLGSKVAIGGVFTNTGLLQLDNDIFGTGDAGGSSLAVTGALTNRGDLDIGNSGLATAATVSAASFTNTAIGTVSLTGGTAQASLTIAGAAPTTLTGFYYLQGDALLQFGAGHITTIAANSVLRLDGAQARMALASVPASNSALTQLGANNGLFELEDHAAVTVTARTTFNNFGSLEVDALGGGGSRLTLAGTLNNIGSLEIGGSSLVIGGAPALLTAAALTDSGTIGLTGGPGRATLDILGAALPTVTNTINLSGNALLEFGSGSIATIASGGSLSLEGANSRVAINSDPTTSGALAKLANNFGNFDLADGAAVATTVGLANGGNIDVDSSTFSTFLGDGGSSLTIGGTLTNFDTLNIGNSRILAATTVTTGVLSNSGFVNLTGGMAQATLDSTGAAPPTLTGSFDLTGDALLEFKSGGVTAIGAGASLFLDGAQARVALASAPASNSALTGLAKNFGALALQNGAAVTTKVALNNAGTVEIDNSTGNGGSSLALGGALTNSSAFDIGNPGLSKATTVTAPGLANTGTIEIAGGGATQAILHIAAAAPTSLVGNYSLSGDALLEYNGGGITAIGTVASGETASLTLNGAKSLVAVAGALTSDSALAGLATNNGTFALENGASLTTKVGLTNSDSLQVDFGFGSGGGGLAIGGALTNNAGANIDIGNSSLAAATTVSAASFANAGALTADSGGSTAATLKITGAAGNTGTAEIDAGFDAGGGGSIVSIGGTLTNSGNLAIGNTNLAKATTVTAAGLANSGTIDLSGGTAAATLHVTAAAPATLAGTYTLAGDALLEFNSGAITGIGSGASLTLSGAKSLVALSTAPTTDSALTGLAKNAGSLILENGAALTIKTGLASAGSIEVDEFGAGGSSLTVGGALSSNSLFIGNPNMTAAVHVGAASFANSGTVEVFSGAAAASLTLTGAFGNTGFADIDSGFGATGGSVVTIGGTLSNSDTFDVGLATLGKATTVTAAGLANTGTINLAGGSTVQAKLNIAAAAPATLAGTYNLSGDALLEFGSGGVTSIGSGGSLSLSGPLALVALASKPTTNSALTGLATNAGTFDLANGAALTTSTGLANSGTLGIDNGFGATGGSSLSVGGTLSNSAFNLTIGNSGLSKAATVTAKGLANTGTINLTGSATATAALDITAAAPATLSGTYTLSGDALLEFASGGITGISGELTLAGAQALVALAGKPTTDSALTGLAGNTGTLTIENGATLTTTTGFTNSGTLDIDSGFGATGGSAVTIGGALTNGSFETIAIGNTGLTAATTVKAASLANAGSLSLASGAAAASLSLTGAFGNTDFVQIDTFGGGGSSLSIGGTLTNSATFEIGNLSLAKATTVIAAGLANTGTIDLTGSTTAAATLDVTGAAPATLTGAYNLSDDALLEFASGGVTAIGGGASLTLNGAQALAALAGKLTTDSALAGLASNAGTLTIENGAAPTTTTGFTNSGTLGIDSGFGATGGSSLAIGGTLTNSSFGFAIGNSSLVKATTVKATGLANTGTVDLTGSATAAAALDITAAAPATLSGTFNLSGDALLEFASGGIAAIGSGASLTLNGANALVALAGKLTTDSALTGLAGNAGTFNLENGAALTTTTAFANSGIFDVDTGFGAGGSSLVIGGALTNNSFDTINIGNGDLSAATTLTAASLNNNTSAGIAVFGSSTDTATLSLAGASTNAGNLTIDTGGVLALGGALTVSGSLAVDGGAVSGGTLATSGSGTLEAGSFQSGTLTGVTIGSGSTFTAEFGSTLTVSGVTVSGALNGSGSATLDFAKTGTDSLTNVSGFPTIGLATGTAANILTLADANFAGTSGLITINDGNSGNTVNASTLSAANAVTVQAGTGADVLTGGAGNDVFVAGGATAMTGGGGANQFTFEAPGAANTIADFGASSTNELVFSNAGFNLGQSSAGPSPQALPLALFTANATGVFGNTAERLAYDTANGKLFASADGSGSTPQLVATLTGHPAITAATQLFFIS